MKVQAGPMWNTISSARMPLRLFGYIMIGPALLGQIVAPASVMWTPAWIWPGTVLISVSFVLIGIITALLLMGFIQRIRISRTIVVEECCILLGMILALVIGAYAFGPNPTKWDEPIPLQRNGSKERSATE